MNSEKKTRLSTDRSVSQPHCRTNISAINNNIDAPVITNKIIDEEVRGYDQLREINRSSAVDFTSGYSFNSFLNDIDFQKVTLESSGTKISSDFPDEVLGGRAGDDLTPSWGTSCGRPGDDLTPSWGTSYGRPGEDLETLRRPVTVECRQILTPDGSVLVQKRLRVHTSSRCNSEQGGEVTTGGEVYSASISAIVLNDCLRPKSVKINTADAVDSPMVLSRSTSLRLRPSNEYSLVGANREITEEDQVIERNRLRWSADYNSKTRQRRSIGREYSAQMNQAREYQLSGSGKERLIETREEQLSEARGRQPSGCMEEKIKVTVNDNIPPDIKKNSLWSLCYDSQKPASRQLHGCEIAPERVKTMVRNESEDNSSDMMTSLNANADISSMISSNNNVIDSPVSKYRSQFLTSRGKEQTNSIRSRGKEQVNLICSDVNNLTSKNLYKNVSLPLHTPCRSQNTPDHRSTLCLGESQQKSTPRPSVDVSTSLSSNSNQAPRLRPSSCSTIEYHGRGRSAVEQVKDTLRRGLYEEEPVRKTLSKGLQELGRIKETLSRDCHELGQVKYTSGRGHYELGQVKETPGKGHYELGQLNESTPLIMEDRRNSRPMGSVPFYRSYSKQVFKHAPKLTGFDVDTLNRSQDKKTMSSRESYVTPVAHNHTKSKSGVEADSNYRHEARREFRSGTPFNKHSPSKHNMDGLRTTRQSIMCPSTIMTSLGTSFVDNCTNTVDTMKGPQVTEDLSINSQCASSNVNTLGSEIDGLPFASSDAELRNIMQTGLRIQRNV